MPSSNVLWVPPLTRLKPWYPGQFGVPGSDNKLGLRLDANGAVFYVDPNHADANTTADGTDPNQPLSTITAALARCTAYNNDVIVVMNNSYWTYADTTQGRATPVSENVTVSVAGVRIVGLAPPGALGVPWVPTANSQTLLTINAMDVLVEGFCFWANSYTGVTAVLSQWDGATYYGENTTVKNCFFYDVAYGVTFDYSYNCYVVDNVFQGVGTAAVHNSAANGNPAYTMISGNVFNGCTTAINFPDADDNVIENNHFVNNTTAIAMITVASHNVIKSNTIVGNAAGTNNFINLSGGAAVLNLVADNWLGCTVAQYDTTCSPGGGGADAWINNHCINGDATANPT